MFRLQSKDIFLTYPKAKCDFESLYNHIISLPKLRYAIVCEELHQDLSIHFHAYLLFESKRDIKSERYFDFGHDHPNIEKPKSRGASINYCKKDGKFREFGSLPDNKPVVQDIFVAAATMDFESYFQSMYQSGVPYQYAKLAWDRKHIICREIMEHEIAGHIDPRLHFVQPQPRKSTVLVGPTGCGKTQYAKYKASKPALFISDIDDLKSYHSGIQSLIFDDMSFVHWPTTTQIHLVDQDDTRSIRVRYAVVTIPAHTEKWFTCNSEPFIEHEAITRRLNKINLYS